MVVPLKGMWLFPLDFKAFSFVFVLPGPALCSLAVGGGLCVCFPSLWFATPRECVYWCPLQVSETYLFEDRLVTFLVYLFLLEFLLCVSVPLSLLLVHHFLSPKHFITDILKSLSTRPKSGSSVNLCYPSIFSEFPCLSAVISDRTGSAVGKRAVGAAKSALHQREATIR